MEGVQQTQPKRKVVTRLSQQQKQEPQIQEQPQQQPEKPQEQQPLDVLFSNIESPKSVDNFLAKSFEVICHRIQGNKTVTINGVAPFFTIEDLQRAIWVATNKANTEYPNYSFLAIEKEGQFEPALGTFRDQEGAPIFLPNPVETIRNNRIQQQFIDSEGHQTTSVLYLPRGRTTLEDAFLKHSTPVFHTFSFDLLLNQYRGQRPISNPDWYGLFHPYFPNLTPASTVGPLDYSKGPLYESYINSKINQTVQLTILLDESVGEFIPLRTTSVKHLMFQWIEQKPTQGVDTLFDKAPVTSLRPYMRLLTPGIIAISKLHKAEHVSLPTVSDPVLLRNWVSEPAPTPVDSFLIVKILIRKEDYGVLPLYGTLRVMDNANATFTIQPPKDIESLNFQRDISKVKSILEQTTQDMPFNLQSIRLGRASIQIELEVSSINSRQIIQRIRNRIPYFNTLFQQVEPPAEETKPAISLRYKAISNFFGTGEDNKDKIFSYLAYISKRDSEKIRGVLFANELASEFQLSEDESREYITQFLQNSDDYSIGDSDTNEFLSLHNSGIDIGIYTIDIKRVALVFYTLRSISIDDFRRACTILQIISHTPDDMFDTVLSEIDSKSETVERIEPELQQSSLQAEAAVSSTAAYMDSVGQEGDPLMNADIDESSDEEFVPPQVPQQAPLKKPTPKEANAEPERIIAHKWFITQLQKLDPVLFNYKPEQNKGEKHYTSKCAANWDRQPAILTQEQYTRMREIYAKDEGTNKVGFIVYGIPDTDDTIKSAKGKIEQITVLRYGSDPTNLHYFLCTALFCLRDKLPILNSDWKEKKECPFCGGKKIIDLKKPGPNETVILRKDKPGFKKKHTFVGFQNGHPNGLGLPCCFTGPETLGWKDARFDTMRQASRVTATEVALQNQLDEEEERKRELREALYLRMQEVVNYDALRIKLSREYVLGQEKYPLEPGKVGVPNLAIDSYFGQDSSNFVSRVATKQEFKPNVNGLFRLGVLNRNTMRNDSLFSALAPLLGLSTLQQVKDYIVSIISPRVFINLNFGNLLLEFYTLALNDKDLNNKIPAPTDNDLNSWSLNYLQINTETNIFEIRRFFISYQYFKYYIDDPEQKKELRHFVHALAEPKLYGKEEGLTLIVLEYKGDPRNSSTKIEVKCPILGFDIQRYSQNSIGFLTLNSTGIWEPLVYVSRLNQFQTTPVNYEGYYTLTDMMLRTTQVPTMIKERIIEFMTECRSSYRGAFTMQLGIDKNDLLTVSEALYMFRSLIPTGIVRDSYNHLVAITVKSPAKNGKDVLVPVVDDGNSFYFNMDLRIHVGFQGIDLASANDVLEVYRNIMSLTVNKLYTFNKFIKTDKIIGFILQANDKKTKIMLPCSDASSPIDEKKYVFKLRLNTFMFEYQLNRKMIIESDTSNMYKESSYLLKKKQVEDIYEHLRLSFGTWIATKQDGIEMRNKVSTLLEDKTLPSWEKMRRLEIEFGPLLQSWFTSDNEQNLTGFEFLRTDCISIEDDIENKCTGVCKPKDGTCRIHTPETIQIRTGPSVDAVAYFTTRLFDEIVRLPVKRQEFFTNSVKRLQVPRTNVHRKNEWILPENVPAWYDLLRGSVKGSELPRYYEEFSKIQDVQEQPSFYSTIQLPDSLKSYFIQNAESAVGLRILGPPGSSSNVFNQYFGIGQTEEKRRSLTELEFKEISQKYGYRPIAQINLQSNILQVYKASFHENKAGIVILIPRYELGPAVCVFLKDNTVVIPLSMLNPNSMASVKTAKRVYKNPAEATPVAEQNISAEEQEVFDPDMVEEEASYFEQVD